MKKDLSMSFTVNQSPQEVFAAVNNVTKWWTENLEGKSHNKGEHFDVHFGDVHYSRQLLTEIIPNKKIVWKITEGKLNFVDKTDEWTGTEIVFDILPQGDKTQLTFTHKGLTPQLECYDACSGAWTDYIQKSLHQLITKGKGMPEPKDD
jgi:hypothetical protein